MKYLDKKHIDRRHADRTHRRVTTGEPCGDFAVCERCRWPFRRWGTSAMLRCSDCWQEAKHCEVLAMYVTTWRRRLWDRGDQYLESPPGHAERLALYAARAEAGRPLFEEG